MYYEDCSFGDDDAGVIGKVYSKKSGERLATSTSGNRGFRQESLTPNRRVEVVFYVGLGWLTESEHLKLCQIRPRIAP